VANPAPASSVTLAPAQDEDGPLIVTTGVAVTVTVVGADVAEHPAASVTVTE